MSVHGVTPSLEYVEVIIYCFQVLLGGCVHFDCSLNDDHDALIDIPHFMRDIAYHEQENYHVLLVLPSGLCRLILEIRLEVRRAVL